MDEQWHDAVIDYQYEGREFSFHVPCRSLEEAEARLRAIRESARVEGWPCFRYSANPITLPIGSLWTRIKIWMFERGRR